MSLRIGLDLDNTLICYDRAFEVAAKERGLIPHDFSGNKQQIRDFIRALPGRDGEREWQKLQGYVYGKGIQHAELFAGVTEFLQHAVSLGATLHIVSHKTQFGHFDPDKVDLREAAKAFLQAMGVFAHLPQDQVSFHTTRDEKIARITELDFDLFIDDLEEVLGDPSFPVATKRFLFSAIAPEGTHSFESFADWQSIRDTVFPTPQGVAAILLGRIPESVALAGGGGNSRIYRVESEGKSYALKMYPAVKGDRRDRLGVERRALRFFEQYGVKQVPRWLGDMRGFALLSWAEGILALPHKPGEIEQAAQFVGVIKRLNGLKGAEDFSAASEACTSGAEILVQIDRRLERLKAISPAEPALDRFLKLSFEPALQIAADLARAGYAARGLDFDTPLDRGLCLIPADFGFHNILRGPDGSLTFIDFEYFGWDDPVKLVADFLLHPAMTLAPYEQESFRSRMVALFEDDAGFAPRLGALKPLFALRWALILLNEFLPERWSGRAFARGESEWEAAKARQLAKAEQMMLHSSTRK